MVSNRFKGFRVKDKTYAGGPVLSDQCSSPQTRLGSLIIRRQSQTFRSGGRHLIVQKGKACGLASAVARDAGGPAKLPEAGTPCLGLSAVIGADHARPIHLSSPCISRKSAGLSRG